jgi:hypothetical protein
MSNVVRTDPNTYGKDFYHHLLEQYKVVRQSIDSAIVDRNTLIKYWMTASTAILAVPILALAASTENLNSIKWFLILAFPALGIGVSIIWIRWTKSFGYSLGARYAVLKEIETHLPAAPFLNELAYRDKFAQDAGWKRHLPGTTITTAMAKLYLVANIFVLVGILVMLLIK